MVLYFRSIEVRVMELLKVVEEIIERLGFPTFVAGALAWFCYKLITENFKEIAGKLNVLTSLTDTLHTKVDILEERLENIEKRS
jgi:hypothetical protein